MRVIEKMIALRAEKARILGYPTFADYVIEDRMAGCESPESIVSSSRWFARGFSDCVNA